MSAPFECTLDHFVPLIGDAFEITDGSASIRAKLVDATDLREVQAAGRRSRQFSLVWRGPPGRILPQRIYAVRHPSFGALELFLVTIGPDAEGMRYEAIFT